MHFIDRTGLFKISNLGLGGGAIVTNLYISLERQREWESDREIKKTSKTRGDYASCDTGTALRK
jgi:hypothetical protein